MKKIGFGIVGTGHQANEHAKIIDGLKEAKLIAVYGDSRERVNEFARKYKIKAYTNYKSFLKDKDIHIINIVSIPNQHADQGIEAAKAKKHILVEKPIDISLEKARKLINICKKNKVKLSVMYQERFSKQIIKLKEDIIKGEFGKILFCSTSMNWMRDKEWYNASGGWRKMKKEAGGGVLISQAIHYIDLLQWLINSDVKSVYCRTKNRLHNTEVEDTVAGIINFRDGTLGLIKASIASNKQHPDIIEVYGTKKSKVLHISHNFMTRFIPRHSSLIKRQMENMIDAVKNNKEPAVTGEEGLKSLKIVISLYDSAKKGKEVKIS